MLFFDLLKDLRAIGFICFLSVLYVYLLVMYFVYSQTILSSAFTSKEKHPEMITNL